MFQLITSEDKSESKSFQVLHIGCHLIPSCTPGWEKFAQTLTTAGFFFLFPVSCSGFLACFIELPYVIPHSTPVNLPLDFFFFCKLTGNVNDAVVITTVALLIWDFSPHTTLWDSLLIRTSNTFGNTF